LKRFDTTRLLSLVLALLLASCSSSDEAPESGLAWRSLFDGRTTRGWRGYRRQDMPEGWQVRDGALVRVGPGGDIVTEDQFGDFVLSLEWKISPGGNSGIFFRVTEDQDATWQSAPEYQILDNALHADGGDPRTSAGANYALHAPPADFTRPPGEWNQAMIEVRGPYVRHWLNGHLIVDYELGSPDWTARVEASKFHQWPAYGRSLRGHIALQDHGDVVSYRNIRILTLD